MDGHERAPSRNGLTGVAGTSSTNLDLFFIGLDRLPDVGQEQYARGFDLQMGGGIPGTMILLSRLGIPVRLQTALGRDLFSAYAAGQFRAAGIEPVNLWDGASDAIPLNLSVAMLTSADRTFVSYSDGFAVTDAVLTRIYQASAGSAVCVMDPRFTDVYEQLHREGTKLVLDPGWDDRMSVRRDRRLLELADFYTPNRMEAMQITGRDTPAEAARVLGDFFETVLIKLDAEGCLIQNNGSQRILPPVSDFGYRDSTGAGDAFLAGFLYGLYRGRTVPEAALYGNITGAKCVSAVGCLAASCTEPELLALADEKRAWLSDN